MVQQLALKGRQMYYQNQLATLYYTKHFPFFLEYLRSDVRREMNANAAMKGKDTVTRLN